MILATYSRCAHEYYRYPFTDSNFIHVSVTDTLADRKLFLNRIYEACCVIHSCERTHVLFPFPFPFPFMSALLNAKYWFSLDPLRAAASQRMIDLEEYRALQNPQNYTKLRSARIMSDREREREREVYSNGRSIRHYWCRSSKVRRSFPARQPRYHPPSSIRLISHISRARGWILARKTHRHVIDIYPWEAARLSRLHSLRVCHVNSQ